MPGSSPLRTGASLGPLHTATSCGSEKSSASARSALAPSVSSPARRSRSSRAQTVRARTWVMAVVSAKISRPMMKADENNSCWREPVTSVIQSKIGCSGSRGIGRRRDRADGHETSERAPAHEPVTDPRASRHHRFHRLSYPAQRPRRLLPPAPDVRPESTSLYPRPRLPPKGPRRRKPAPKGRSEPVTYGTAKQP